MNTIPFEIKRVKYPKYAVPIKNPDYIINYVCEFYGITKKQFLTKRARKNIFTARVTAMALIRETMPHYSLHGLRDLFKVTNHSTIIKNIQKFKKDMPKDDYNQIKKLLFL